MENEEVTVTVTERGIENAKPVSATKAIPYDTRLDVSSFEIKHDDNGYYASATVTNNGSKPSDEINVTLNNTADKTFGTTSYLNSRAVKVKILQFRLRLIKLISTI